MKQAHSSLEKDQKQQQWIPKELQLHPFRVTCCWLGRTGMLGSTWATFWTGRWANRRKIKPHLFQVAKRRKPQCLFSCTIGADPTYPWSHLPWAARSAPGAQQQLPRDVRQRRCHQELRRCLAKLCLWLEQAALQWLMSAVTTWSPSGKVKRAIFHLKTSVCLKNKTFSCAETEGFPALLFPELKSCFSALFRVMDHVNTLQKPHATLNMLLFHGQGELGVQITLSSSFPELLSFPRCAPSKPARHPVAVLPYMKTYICLNS